MSKALRARLTRLEGAKKSADKTSNHTLYYKRRSVGTVNSDTHVWQIGFIPKDRIGRGKLGEFKGKFILRPHFETDEAWEAEASATQDELLNWSKKQQDRRNNQKADEAAESFKQRFTHLFKKGTTRS